MKTLIRDRKKAVLAAVSGLLMAAAFPNLGLTWFAWVGLVPLLITLRGVSIQHGLQLGFLAGFFHYLGLVYWVAFTMKTYGHLPLLLSLFILGLMAAYLALYWALFTTVLTWVRPKPGFLPVLAPLVWVACEYLRSHLFTGFPWGLFGHSQYKALHFIQICDITGAYGLSFLIVLFNTAVYLGLLRFARKQWNGCPVGRWQVPIVFLGLGALLISAWGYGAYRLKKTDHLVQQAPKTAVAVIQGNIDQSVKWDPAYQILTTNIYRDLSLLASRKAPDLIVWPETATPFYYLANKRLTKVVNESIVEANTHFLIGSPAYMRTESGPQHFNSAYLIEPDGSVAGRYDKVHLVPYGEYIPLKKWLPFLGKIVAQVGDFSAGTAGNTLQWGQKRLGVLICYEIIFPGLAQSLVRNKADVLMNITNDAWFGRTGAAQQHFSMAVFRAVENRRALVRAANTGISGYIDPAGRILQATPLFERHVLHHPVPLLQETTFYHRVGDLFAIICLLGALVWSVGPLIISRMRTTTKP